MPQLDLRFFYKKIVLNFYKKNFGHRFFPGNKKKFGFVLLHKYSPRAFSPKKHPHRHWDISYARIEVSLLSI
jgi:hypothetical protein